MLVPVKTPELIQRAFPGFIWKIETSKKEIFLTFDDGPIPELTHWIIDVLKSYQAKASFFMVGENVERNPELVARILEEGHSVGNHTHNHLNGFKTRTADYLTNVDQCAKALEPFLNPEKTRIFRPPYGRIAPNQAKKLKKVGYKIILWDILSLDYDSRVSPNNCAQNVIKNAKPGSIVVFHDNIKANKNIRIALPMVLENLTQKGFQFLPLFP